ncbi:hypothetical protein SHKM778_30400 [Streptomyces sp. KM77-8]|uniref:Ada DNA repair metal-binding domain-containing protein n=1 Tax=Streptomyces haneummycinicus TaxID=3074435 RepID=A0AAT9HHL1_9ACTN
MRDEDSRYEAVRSRDARFDGAFFFAVRTTGIYCRPSCPAVTPKRHNVSFFATAAAAQGSDSAPAGAAARTPYPAPPSGTYGPTSSAGPCG